MRRFGSPPGSSLISKKAASFLGRKQAEAMGPLENAIHQNTCKNSGFVFFRHLWVRRITSFASQRGCILERHVPRTSWELVRGTRSVNARIVNSIIDARREASGNGVPRKPPGTIRGTALSDAVVFGRKLAEAIGWWK